MLPSTPLPPEAIPFQRDAPGVTLDAAFRWRDIPPPPRAPEVSADGLREAQRLTALSLKIDLTEAGRMRAELIGAAFPLPAHSELRARADQYGNLLVWPNAGGYRVIAPGALRTLLGERRVDVTPLSPGSLRPQGEGPPPRLPGAQGRGRLERGLGAARAGQGARERGGGRAALPGAGRAGRRRSAHQRLPGGRGAARGDVHLAGRAAASASRSRRSPSARICRRARSWCRRRAWRRCPRVSPGSPTGSSWRARCWPRSAPRRSRSRPCAIRWCRARGSSPVNPL